MSLPTYDKSKRRADFAQLPKDAYVVRLMAAKEEPNKSGNGRHLKISCDIAEGEYKDFYAQQYERSTAEDKKWPADGIFILGIPEENDEPWKFTNWNTFFSDLEDSNNGFVFAGDLKALKGKLIGGKFYIEQSESNGNIYNHTRLRWTCVVDDVRSGKAAKSLPNDKLIGSGKASGSGSGKSYAKPSGGKAGFMDIPDDAVDDFPF